MTAASPTFRVENITKGTVLGRRIRVARSALDRTRGLLGTSSLEADEGLWIESAPSIHMFFMRFTIDAVFVNGDHRVTRVVEGLAPWRVVWWARGAKDCLELPAGTIRTSRTEPGDQLRRVAAETARIR